MRNDADFAAYLAARWPLLVRSLVLIGCPRAEAEDLVVAGLASCVPSYDRVRETDDIDVHVYRTVLARWHRRRGPVEVPLEPPAEVETDEVLLRREIEAELRSLPTERREELVLQLVAELTETQVSDVLERPVYRERSRFSEADFRTARDTIEVSLPPYDAVVAQARSDRRRRRRITLAAVAAGVLVVAGLGWVSTRPAPEPPQNAKVTASKNPITLPWYGGGRLQLRSVAVELPQINDLVKVGDGALYSDGDGVVTHVDSTGELTTLGQKPIGSPIVASDERSWAAWVVSGDNPELVVKDLTTGEDVASLEVPPGARPVALDQNRLYYVSNGRSYIWEPLTDRVADLGQRIVLDVESAQRVYDLGGGRIDIAPAFFSTEYARPGTSAELSPGGTYVVSRQPGQPQGPFHPLLYDARSGDRLPSGVGRDELALDAAFGPDDTIDYLVIRAADYGVGPDLEGNDRPLTVLRTCDLETSTCSDIVPLARADEEPRLAH